MRATWSRRFIAWPIGIERYKLIDGYIWTVAVQSSGDQEKGPKNLGRGREGELCHGFRGMDAPVCNRCFAKMYRKDTVIAVMMTATNNLQIETGIYLTAMRCGWAVESQLASRHTCRLHLQTARSMGHNRQTDGQTDRTRRVEGWQHWVCVTCCLFVSLNVCFVGSPVVPPGCVVAISVMCEVTVPRALPWSGTSCTLYRISRFCSLLCVFGWCLTTGRFFQVIPDSFRLSPYTPPTRLNCRVESRQRCVLNSRLVRSLLLLWFLEKTGFPRLLENPGKSWIFFFKFPEPGKSWKNILENYASLKSPASLALNLVSWFSAK